MRRIPLLLALGLALTLVASAHATITRAASPDTMIGPCSMERPVPFWTEIRPAFPCWQDSVTVVFRSCRDCVDLVAAGRLDSLHLVLRTRSPRACPVIDLCTPDSLVLRLGRYAMGHHALDVRLEASVYSNDTLLCTMERRVPLAFEVRSCEPSPPGILPFVTDVRIGRPGPCLECPPKICPGDSIPFFVTGIFPSDCFGLRRIEVLPYPPNVDPLPGSAPYFVRLIVDDFACVLRICAPGQFPFHGMAMMPPLPGGTFGLMIQEARVSCSDSVRDEDSIYVARVPFVVADRCTTTVQGCLLADFERPGGNAGCGAFVSRDAPAVVTLGVSSPVALSGLQGEFMLYPPGLRIADLAPIGPARGMHLQWRPTERGAKWVMFAESGAPIPPAGRDSAGHVFPCRDSAGNVYRCQVPVLGIKVVEEEGGNPAPVTSLSFMDILGADISGQSVPDCPTLMGFRFAPPMFRICRGAPCDFNGDGLTDVRDLVTMVHCVLHAGPCPDSTADFDCNRDGRRTIDDVLCCARAILRSGAHHDSIPGRPEPGIEISFGEPVRTAEGLDVPLRLSGADRIGAARLALAFPRDRFDVASVEIVGEASDWLNLHEVTDEALVVGLIGMASGGTQAAHPSVDLMLHLTLKSGREPGGELRLRPSEFSGPDGAVLKVDLGSPALTIAGPTLLSLSAGRPNPFSGETRFLVNLSRAADVDLAVHDLSGRRVAVIHRGRLEAGSHPFTWNGTRADGARAAQGIYFFRALAAGQTASSRVVLLRGN